MRRLIDIAARIGKRAGKPYVCARVITVFQAAFRVVAFAGDIPLPDSPSSETVLPVDESAFRALMGQFATGVCVVAAQGPQDAGDGAGAGPVGITVNSFVSVSLNPMLVCWSLHNSSSQFDIWTRAKAYSISILGADQQAIASNYAVRDNASDPAHFMTSAGGVPHIAGALGHLECRPWKTYPAGDHTMILGEVTGLYRADTAQGASAQPLLFFGSAFRHIGE